MVSQKTLRSVLLAGMLTFLALCMLLHWISNFLGCFYFPPTFGSFTPSTLSSELRPRLQTLQPHSTQQLCLLPVLLRPRNSAQETWVSHAVSISSRLLHCWLCDSFPLCLVLAPVLPQVGAVVRLTAMLSSFPQSQSCPWPHF